jgi:uncharacterized protein
MKSLNYSLIIVIIISMGFACNISTGKLKSDIPVSTYDKDKAQKYKADELGMKKYVMAFLKRGPNRETDPVKAAELQKAHLKNIGRLADEGKLILAGPFLDDGEIRGIYIFNVETLDEARQLTETDPAIKSGHLIMELKPWYGSAALIEVNSIHKTLAQKKLGE